MHTGEALGLPAQPTLAGADGEFASAGGNFDEATGGIPTEGGGAISHYSWLSPIILEISWSFFYCELGPLSLWVKIRQEGV